MRRTLAHPISGTRETPGPKGALVQAVDRQRVVRGLG